MGGPNLSPDHHCSPDSAQGGVFCFLPALGTPLHGTFNSWFQFSRGDLYSASI